MKQKSDAPRGVRPELSVPLALFVLVLTASAPVNASSYADGGEEMACWKAKLMVPCETVFPGVDIFVDWDDLTSDSLREGDTIRLPSHLVVPDATSDLNITTATFKAHDYKIDHTNLHACKVSNGFCSPFVGESPGLVTHSAALKGTPGPQNKLTFELTLEPGDWTFITHYRIFIDENIRCDFAKGKIFHVEPLRVEIVASEGVKTMTVVLAVLGVLISAMFLAASIIYRKKNVFKLASWKFCALASLGGILGNSCILLWLPPFTTLVCQLRPFLLPIAFDILYFPLLLKTWRLQVLLVDTRENLKKVRISDLLLAKCILVPVIVDIIIGIVWVLVDPPTPVDVQSLISSTRYEIYCKSVSSAFMIVSIVIKVPFILWGLKLSWSTRAILSVMNESSHILLSMLNLFFVGAYVIVIQFLITDSQSALVMLRVLGTFVSATLTLSIVLGPKVIRLICYGDIEGLASAVRNERIRRLSQATSVADNQAEESMMEVNKYSSNQTDPEASNQM